MSVAQTGWSADGNWFWDGSRWNDALSADGRWRFDGTSWQPFAGQRTPMPVQAWNAVPPAPAAPPAATALPDPAAAASLPSWVDASETERIEREKIERRIAEMTPEEPLPPERDWRRVGEFMKYSPTSSGPAFWKTGWTSALIYIALLWLCAPVALIFVWLTEWRMFTKVYRTVISGVWSIALFDYVSTHVSLPG